jgi:hypothetical protein
MNWLVERGKGDGTAVLGELLIGGVHECWTLEPADPIDAGTYDLAVDWSDRFQRLMPHVMNVPNHTGIRIHWGNWAKDTEDCLLVGTVKGTDFVGHSVAEFDILFQKLQDALAEGPVTITYVDYDPNLPNAPNSASAPSGAGGGGS